MGPEPPSGAAGVPRVQIRAMEFPRKRAFSDISAGGAEAYWDDVRSLYAAAESMDISVESGASFADVSFGSFGPVIDTTSGKAVLAGARPVRQDTTLEVAELFCGGFNGWSQGVRVLSTFGYSLAVKWLLDTAEECYEGSRQQHPDLQKVFSK